jgi:serine/threonine protein kinase
MSHLPSRKAYTRRPIDAASVILAGTMADPRIPESAIRAAIDGIDELTFIDGGGQGDAWRIRRNGGGDEFLKVIVRADTARVAQEIGTMQAVSSPYVMKFTEAGSLTHGSTAYPFIIGEYISDRSIAARLENDEWPDEEEALAATLGCLRGLEAVHDRDVVHRDVKPGNLALREDDWAKPVLLDLGLVRDLLGNTITVYPAALGTDAFMAPEQLRKEPAVRRSDVFAAGVTLFALLTREHPFLDAGEQTVALEVFEERITDEDWPKWKDVDIEDGVRQILDSMLRPDPYDRPRAQPAAEALESILASR